MPDMPDMPDTPDTPDTATKLVNLPQLSLGVDESRDHPGGIY